MGKAKNRQKNGQRAAKRPKGQQVGAQQERTPKNAVREEGRHSEYILNEKVVEMGGGQPRNKQTEAKSAGITAHDSIKTEDIPEAEIIEESGFVPDEEEFRQEAADTAVETEKSDEKESRSIILPEKVVEEGAVEPEKARVTGKSAELGTTGELSSHEVKATKNRSLGQKLHVVNIDYPWLKVVCAIFLFILVVMGIGLLVSNNLRGDLPDEDSSVQGEAGEGQDTDDEGEPKDDEKPAEEKPTEEPDSPQSTEVKEETPSVTVAPPPAATTPDVPAGRKLIALTFDDGPSSVTTPRLLDILAQKGVKATFFVLGSMAQRAPDIVKREEAEGHEVASHTPWHNNQASMNATDIRAEANTMNQIFMDILGHGPAFTRPPYGAISQTLRDNLAQPLILWSIDPEDWKYRNAATVRYNVVSAAHDGAIILVHDIHSTTVDAVPYIIDDLRAQGYEFLTVSELALARGVTLLNGYAYYSFRP